MRRMFAAALISVGAPNALITAPVSAEVPAAPSAFNVATTDLGTLLDDPAAKAVLVKHIPTLVSNEQISMARSMTLKQLQQYAGDTLTDATLAQIQGDLDKLPQH